MMLKHRSDLHQPARPVRLVIALNKAVWMLLATAIAAWGICAVFPASSIHFGWVGTLLASSGGLAATISSSITEEEVCLRGGVVHKTESPIQFFAAYALVALMFIALMALSISGCLGLLHTGMSPR